MLQRRCAADFGASSVQQKSRAAVRGAFPYHDSEGFYSMAEDHQHLTIEAEEAVIYLITNYEGKKGLGRFYIGLREYKGGLPPFEYTYDYGAHNAEWQDDFSDEQRVQHVLDHALEAMVVHRCDPVEVIREVRKVRQVYDLAEGSTPL